MSHLIKTSHLTKTVLSLLALLALPMSLQAGASERSLIRDSAKSCDFNPEFQPQSCRPQGHHPSTFRTFIRHYDGSKPESCYPAENSLAGCCPIVTSMVIHTSANTILESPVENPARHTVESTIESPVNTEVERKSSNTASPNTASPNTASPNTVSLNTVSPVMEAVCLPVGSVVSCDSTCCDATGTPPALAELIHRSQTASYGWERRDAIHKLSDKFDCKCHPEVMTALLFALNDSDERVRSKTADEIGDQLRVNPGCCSPTVLNALQYAMGDCDRFVRRQAEEALRAAGYDLVDGCCQLRRVNVEVTCAPVQVPLSVNLPAIRTTHTPANFPIRSEPVLPEATIVPPAASPAITPARSPALFPVSVPVNDATPTRPAAAESVAPPPVEKPVPFSFPSTTPDVGQSGHSAGRDAPVPLATGLAGHPDVDNNSGNSARLPSSPARNRPLRQGLSNLFNQGRFSTRSEN